MKHLTLYLTVSVFGILTAFQTQAFEKKKGDPRPIVPVCHKMNATEEECDGFAAGDPDTVQTICNYFGAPGTPAHCEKIVLSCPRGGGVTGPGCD